jgi:lantibiotic leader peptide-processing serine protease
MHDWRFIPGLKTSAVTLSAIAILAWSAQGAFAQEQHGNTNDELQDTNTTTYLLEASGGSWGAAQDDAVIASGGTIIFKHVGSGLGIASSIDPVFMRKALKSPAFVGVAEDEPVQWVDPDAPATQADDITEDSVNPTNDTFINLLWNMKAIDAQGAWNAGFDGLGVRVAVVDGGMCDLHPDIAPNLDVAHSTSFVPGFHFNQDTGTAASFRHACHVAGIIAAADNSIGTVGVAPRATIISVKVLHNGSGSFGQVIQGILYAADPISAGGGGADIINMSLGAVFPRGGGNTGAGELVAAMNKAVNYATSHNVLVVSAAGNNALDMDHSGSLIEVPGMSGSGIAISATAPVGFAVGYPNSTADPRAVASYTNYGHSIVTLAAPGGDFALPGNALCVLPRVPSGTVTNPCWVFDGVFSPGSQSGSYFWATGTSMASPHVAGVAALIKQAFPGISVGDLKQHLLDTADDEGAVGADPFYGQGFVNAHRAVTEPLTLISNPSVESVTPPASVDLAISRKSGSSIPEVSFIMHKAGPVRVDLFDLAGRHVATLYNGVAAAGRTTVSWNGRGARGQSLDRGAYFARAKADGAQAVRKMMLVD